MNIFILTLTFLLSFSAFSCPSLQGSWKSCHIATELLNPIESVAVNLALKSYTFEFSNPKPNILKSKIIKSGLFSGQETIAEERSVIGINNKVVWEKNIIEGSTPPEMTSFYNCNSNGMIEYISWDNLSVENYPDHQKVNYPRYFKSEYIVSGNKITRQMYARKKPTDAFAPIAKITCKK